MKATYITFFVLFNFFTPAIQSRANFKAIAFTGISLASIYGFYRWVSKPPPFEPTLEKLRTLTITPTHYSNHSDKTLINLDQLVKNIHMGNIPPLSYVPIQKNVSANLLQPTTPVLIIKKGITIDELSQNTIFIFSRGYSRETKPCGKEDALIRRGGCIIGGYAQFRDHIINNSPCITFDYPDNPYYFNFAQALDLQCLEMVYYQTIRMHPNANIVLVGDCRGAKCVLSFAARQPPQLKALILISPFISAQQLTNQVAKSYLSWLPGSSTLLHSFFKWYFPLYDPQQDHILEEVKTIVSDLPIFIGHRKGDTLIADSDMIQLIEALKKTGNTHLHIAILDDSSALHSRLTPIKNFQTEVNLFLKSHNLPYDSSLLEKPKTLALMLQD